MTRAEKTAALVDANVRCSRRIAAIGPEVATARGSAVALVAVLVANAEMAAVMMTPERPPSHRLRGGLTLTLRAGRLEDK